MLHYELADLCLATIGAFYTLAGHVATRAALMSLWMDRALAEIRGNRPARVEIMRSAWLLTAANVVLAGGIALLLRLDLALWLFVASLAGQAAYLLVVAPRYFDVADPPDAAGRRSTVIAAVVYAAATAAVAWAAYEGRLSAWNDHSWQLLAVAAAAIGGHAAYTIRKAVAPATTSPAGGDELEPVPAAAAVDRITVMAEYDAHPLWRADGQSYGDLAPEELDLSPSLTRDLNDWAQAYTASLNRADPANSMWSDEQHRSHAAQGRRLAIRLARERPDLEILASGGDAGLVKVDGDEPE
jgi:hypothetical protein